MRIKRDKGYGLVNAEPNIDRSTGALPGQHNRNSSKRQNLDRWHEAELLKTPCRNGTTKPLKSSATVGKVVIGSTVTVCEAEQLPETFTIVGSERESFRNNNKLFYKSPLGAALLGKTAGTTVQVNAPAGNLNFRILKVK